MDNTKTESKNHYNGEVSHVQSNVPSWLVPEVFEGLLCEIVPGYKKIKDFKAFPAVSAGENYATVVLRIEVEVELDDSQSKTLSYMIKTSQESPMLKELMKIQNFFAIEDGMYTDVVPEMEKMYRDAGIEVKFGARSFKLKTESDIDYILLEDLSPRGFKNANRLEGLDMDHIKSVLVKLAKWHAASATRVAIKGPYPDMYTTGVFKEGMLPMLQMLFASLTAPFEKCLESYKGHEIYGDSMLQIMHGNILETMSILIKFDTNEFNVLNHGDSWCNNIMFQYDAFGKIKETYLVDFQLPKYGSPAQDLFYFLISSAKLEIKTKEFDYFIKFYHDNLADNLRLLKYPKKLPSLKDIHIMLYKYGLWGFSTATGTMSMALLDPTELASMDNMLGDGDVGNQLKLLMYSSERYRKHMECILPWLHNRGALDV